MYVTYNRRLRPPPALFCIKRFAAANKKAKNPKTANASELQPPWPYPPSRGELEMNKTH